MKMPTTKKRHANTSITHKKSILCSHCVAADGVDDDDGEAANSVRPDPVYAPSSTTVGGRNLTELREHARSERSRQKRGKAMRGACRRACKTPLSLNNPHRPNHTSQPHLFKTPTPACMSEARRHPDAIHMEVAGVAAGGLG